VLSLYTCLAQAQPTPSILAVISEVHGTVHLIKANDKEAKRVVFGMQLSEGDRVKTEKKGSVSMLFSNGNLVSLGPGKHIVISEDEMGDHAVRVNEDLAGGFSDLALRQDQKGEMGVLMKLRNDETSQLLILVSPCNTMITDQRPRLSWESLRPADEYMVRLYNSKGLVWEKTTSEHSLAFPENEKELAFGESYFWNVEGLDLIESFKSQNKKFTLLSEEEAQKVKQEEVKLTRIFSEHPKSSSLHTLLGTYYANSGLYEDAIREFELVRDANPESSLPHEILGGLYNTVGKKDLAIEELQKALSLEKEK
jgi:tetratricopeptide (TPR) repeat protein